MSRPVGAVEVVELEVGRVRWGLGLDLGIISQNQSAQDDMMTDEVKKEVWICERKCVFSKRTIKVCVCYF